MYSGPEGQRKIARYSSNGWDFGQAHVYDLGSVELALFQLARERNCTEKNMSLNADNVTAIARLARLKLAESDIDDTVQTLSDIIGFVEQLQAIDTADVEPMAHPLTGMTQRLRDDRVAESDQRERLQNNAPSVADGLYLVPQVID